MSSVTIADNVEHNITQDERTKLDHFRVNPGYGGNWLTVRVGFDKLELCHVTFGRAYGHVSIFYKRDGESYVVYGIGHMDGKRDGKLVYQALWQGCGGSRVPVKVLK